jgi:hypothetical protein
VRGRGVILVALLDSAVIAARNYDLHQLELTLAPMLLLLGAP